MASTLTDLGSLSDSSWNRSLLKWQMIWTSRQEMRGPQPPFRCSAQHYVRTASWCSKAGLVRSWRCLPPRRASMAMPRLELVLSASCLPHTFPYPWGSQQQVVLSPSLSIPSALVYRPVPCAQHSALNTFHLYLSPLFVESLASGCSVQLLAPSSRLSLSASFPLSLCSQGFSRPNIGSSLSWRAPGYL